MFLGQLNQQKIDELVSKYNINGPRYTSYPTALEFKTTNQTANDSLISLQNAFYKSTHNDLSIYVHIPFCKQLCYYCGCHKYLKRENDETVTRYINNLISELKYKSKLAIDYKVVQIHFGGGTPTFADNQQIQTVIKSIKAHYNVDTNAEISIEVDPRTSDGERIKKLIELGFNRFSFGIQDFNTNTQIAINRVQTEESIRIIAESIRETDKSIGFNFDLIYGLPNQTLQSFSDTLTKIIAIKPDRVSVFNYAHMPDRFPEQRRIKSDDLPTAEQKMQIQLQTIETLTKAGYVYLGIDHFALPTDSIAKEQKAKQLHRNFQGYTTHGKCDLLAFGCSGITQLGHVMFQNHKHINDYNKAIENNQIPTEKHLYKNEKDELRWTIIKALLCNFSLNKTSIEKQYNIHFNDYFADEIRSLEQYEKDDLVIMDHESINITQVGRLFARQICKTFDAYAANSAQYSKTI